MASKSEINIVEKIFRLEDLALRVSILRINVVWHARIFFFVETCWSVERLDLKKKKKKK